MSLRQLAATAGVTARAVRYYETIGLVSSDRTSTGARCYPPSVCEAICLIAFLRRLDVPAHRLWPIVDATRTAADRKETLREVLTDCASELSKRLADTVTALEQLEPA